MLHVSTDAEFAKRKMKELNVPIALKRDEEDYDKDGRVLRYINGDELEEAILRKNRNNDLVTSLRVIIEQGQTASMGLNKTLCGIVKRGVGVFVD
jgi:hypothetical protein